MFCVSDPFIAYTSLGVLSVLLFRWESLPNDVKMAQEVVQWASKNLSLMCKARYRVNEHMNCTEHFPRPPRTPHFPAEEVAEPTQATELPKEPLSDTGLTRELDESSSEKTEEQSDDSDES